MLKLTFSWREKIPYTEAHVFVVGKTLYTEAHSFVDFERAENVNKNMGSGTPAHAARPYASKNTQPGAASQILRHRHRKPPEAAAINAINRHKR